MTDELGVLCERLREPFPADDIQWRVQSCESMGSRLSLRVLAYLTNRAVQERLDAVCGAENWQNTPMQLIQITPTIVAIQVGISIRLNGEWITKYDVSEPTHIESVKGGFSGAMKRAGVQWGIGRYLYHLEATEAEAKYANDTTPWPGPGWRRHKDKKHATGIVWWRPPQLPSWALPEWERPITEAQLKAIKGAWYVKFGRGLTGAAASEQFAKFVTERVGAFPIADYRCWNIKVLETIQKKINDSPVGGGPSDDVPFESAG